MGGRTKQKHGQHQKSCKTPASSVQSPASMSVHLPSPSRDRTGGSGSQSSGKDYGTQCPSHSARGASSRTDTHLPEVECSSLGSNEASGEEGEGRTQRGPVAVLPSGGLDLEPPSGTTSCYSVSIVFQDLTSLSDTKSLGLGQQKLCFTPLPVSSSCCKAPLSPWCWLHRGSEDIRVYRTLTLYYNQAFYHGQTRRKLRKTKANENSPKLRSLLSSALRFHTSPH